MADKRINKILWHGNELDDEGRAKAPSVAEGSDGLDGLNDGEVYICNADEDPAMFIRTDAGRVVRVGGGSAGDTYTKDEINQKLSAKVDTAFFSRLFGLMTDTGEEIAVNDVNAAGSSILAKFGLYTEQFLSALGLNPDGSGGGGGGATTLGELANVGEWADEVPQADRVMVQLAGATHWSSKPLSEFVGLDEEALAAYLVENGYATQEWVNGNGYATEEWVTGKGYATQSWVTGKGYLTSVSLATISDLHSSWDELLGAVPSVYVTRWPTFAEVTDKPTTLAGYGITDAYTKQETDTKLSAKMDKATFEELFEKVELSDGTFAIHAKFGLYSDSFLSALGMNPDIGGGGGASSLSELSDVSLSGLQDGQALTWDAAAQKWMNKALEAGLDEAALAEYLASNNYLTATTGDNRYVKKTGDTMTGTLCVQFDVDTSRYMDMIRGYNASGTTRTFSIGYHNTVQNLILNPTGVGSDVWSDKVGNYSLIVGNNKLSYNTYDIVHMGNLSLIDSRYVLKTGDTMTGTLRVRSSANPYGALLTGDATNGYLQLGNMTDNSGTHRGYICGPGGTRIKNLTIIAAETRINSNLYLKADSGGGVMLYPGFGGSDSEVLRIDTHNSSNSWVANALSISSGGSIGIGTVSPQYRLHVVGSGYFSNHLTVKGSVTATYSSSNCGARLTGDMDTGYLQLGNMSSTSTEQKGIICGYSTANLASLNVKGTTNDVLKVNNYAVLNTGNYTSTLDSRYVKKAGDTMTGVLQIAEGTTSNLKGIQTSNGSQALLAHIGNNSYVAQKTGTTRIRSGATNLLHSRNGTDYTIWDSFNDGSGSGLDADLLDGVHLTDVRRKFSWLTKNISNQSPGWYRVFTSTNSNTSYTGQVLLMIGRSYTSPQNENYTFSINVGYNGDISVTQLSGASGTQSITKIRVVYKNNSVWYIDIYNAGYSAEYSNTYGVTGIGHGTFSAFTDATVPEGYSTKECRTYKGCAVHNSLRSVGASVYSSEYVYAEGGWFQCNTNGRGLYNSAQDARWFATSGKWNTDKNIYPTTTNTLSLGDSSYRWLNVFANYGNFSTNLSVAGNASISGTTTLKNLVTINGRSGIGCSGFGVGLQLIDTGSTSLEIVGGSYVYGLGAHSNGSFYIWRGTEGYSSSTGKEYISQFDGTNWIVWGNIRPHSNNAYTIGTSSYRWNYGYFTNLNTNGLRVNGTTTMSGAATLSSTLAVTGLATMNGGVHTPNDRYYSTFNTAGTYCALLGIDGSNYAFVGTTEQTAGTIIRGYEWVAVNFNGLNNSITFSKTEGIYSKIGVYSDGYMSCLGVDSTSDARLKEVLRPVRISLEAMANAPAVAFRWKSGRGEDIGGLAQYWQGVEPLAVKAGKEGWLTMNYAGLAYVLTVSLAGELLALRDEVRTLREEVRQMKANRAA